MGMRRCSRCEKTGHNSRTCSNLRIKNGESVKLFGVEIVSLASSDDDGVGFRKSISLPILSSSDETNSDKLKNGSLSDGFIGTSQRMMRKKGVAWSEEEHKLFLLGLRKLGKGDWKGISSNFVTSRTPTQVASHAQKYFIRQNNAKKKKYRPPLLSWGDRNEDAVHQLYSNDSSISAGIFPVSQSFPNIKNKSNSNHFTLPEIPFCRLFNNSATQNSPSLELSLAAPQPLVWNRRPVPFWTRQYADNQNFLRVTSTLPQRRQPGWDLYYKT
ncbi:hypothetical protein BUALT_Bualt05G0012700 [Buddleja alternifolia]|uniref:Uncharacterized protein n=1 Tax=Buddleja alternifolia TaxID=168488 RepID=A0AAV6XFE9_9LAMI|nr:hypothetical protein BUALT_Bualt05G0012700 [Buddleja alternifolia]